MGPQTKSWVQRKSLLHKGERLDEMLDAGRMFFPFRGEAENLIDAVPSVTTNTVATTSCRALELAVQKRRQRALHVRTGTVQSD
jgi:hypothetical protein